MRELPVSFFHCQMKMVACFALDYRPHSHSVAYFPGLTRRSMVHPQEDRRYFKQQEIELFRAPPQTSAGRAPALHRGTAAAPSAEAEAEAAAAVGPGSAPSHRPGLMLPHSADS